MEIKETKRHSLVDICFGLAALFFVVGTSYYQSSRERMFYYWDLGGYFNMAVEFFDRFSLNWVDGLRFVKQSFASDFSALFAVPLTPFFYLFGESRNVYIVAIALVYLFPCALLLGTLAVKVLPGRRSGVFWSVTGLALLSPYFWPATLSGFPDIGGMIFVLMAALAYLHDISIKRPWQIVVIGFSLAVAILFRRHYGYAAPVFFLSFLIHQGIIVYQGRQDPKLVREFRSRVLRLFYAGIVIMAVMLTVGWGFLVRYSHMDIATLYSAWRISPSAAFLYYVGFFGIPVWVAALTGLWFGVRSRETKTNQAATFTLIYGVAWIAIWIPATHTAIYYYASNLIWMVIAGLSFLGWELWTRRKEPVARVVVGATTLFLTLNLLFGMTSLQKR